MPPKKPSLAVGSIVVPRSSAERERLGRGRIVCAVGRSKWEVLFPSVHQSLELSSAQLSQPEDQSLICPVSSTTGSSPQSSSSQNCSSSLSSSSSSSSSADAEAGNDDAGNDDDEEATPEVMDSEEAEDLDEREPLEDQELWHEEDAEILRDAQHYNQLKILADREKQDLIDAGTEFTVKGYKWMVVNDSVPSTGKKDYDVLGVRINFEQLEGSKTPIYDVFHLLWPSNDRELLNNMNAEIDKDNGTKTLKKHRIRQVTVEEMWFYIAIKVGSGQVDGHGRGKWEPPSVDKLGPGAPDLKKKLTYSRFKEIDKYFSFAWSDNSYNRTDPWWKVRGLFDKFTANRRKHVAASSWKTQDESMSAFKLQVEKNGNLPHISFIKRKPEPLGTEFKDVACSKTGIMLHLEIQEGKEAMAKKEFCSTLKSPTAACTVRLATAAQRCGQGLMEDVNEGIYADSWFGNMTTLKALMDKGFDAVLSIKIGHGHMPKKQVEDIMSQWPGGTYLPLTCTTPKGHKIAFLGYKYGSKKTLFFLFSKNAGSTIPSGDPYQVRFNDRFGNRCKREVPRPHVISSYFEASNKIDRHNHLRQGNLALEKDWVTSCGFKRINTTVMGMCVTDTLLGMRHGMRPNHPLVSLPIDSFAAALANEILYRRTFPRVTFLSLNNPPLSEVGIEQTVLSPAVSTLTEDNDVVEAGVISCIPAGAPVIPFAFLQLHRMKTTEMLTNESRRYRRECSDPECRKKQGDWNKRPKKGSRFCESCNKAYCENKENRRSCFFTHICLEYERPGTASGQWRADFEQWRRKRFDVEQEEWELAKDSKGDE